MHRVISSTIVLIAVFVIAVFVPTPALAQESSSSTGTATCNFDDDKQLVVNYQHVSISLRKPLSMQVPFGKPWAPGGKPMTLFTNVPIQIGSRNLDVGAYTLFVIPTSKQWTLVVSKSTDTSGAYDPTKDLVRVPMEFGELPSPEAELSVTFAHVAPEQCSLRLDLEKYGHFAVFQKK
jgi:hypothetical protein